MYSPLGIIVGASVGLLVTIGVTLLWPKNRVRFLRALTAAAVGFGVAYLLMRLIK